MASALGLAKAGLRVTLVEKKAYPFHRVCGEYVSNEVLPFLRALGADVSSLGPARISRFRLSSPTGKTLDAHLDLGGFGISRFTLDHHLYQLAQQQGVNFILQQTAQEVTFAGDSLFFWFLGLGLEEASVCPNA